MTSARLTNCHSPRSSALLLRSSHAATQKLMSALIDLKSEHEQQPSRALSPLRWKQKIQMKINKKQIDYKSFKQIETKSPLKTPLNLFISMYYMVYNTIKEVATFAPIQEVPDGKCPQNFSNCTTIEFLVVIPKTRLK